MHQYASQTDDLALYLTSGSSNPSAGALYKGPRPFGRPSGIQPPVSNEFLSLAGIPPDKETGHGPVGRAPESWGQVMDQDASQSDDLALYLIVALYLIGLTHYFRVLRSAIQKTSRFRSALLPIGMFKARSTPFLIGRFSSAESHLWISECPSANAMPAAPL